MCIGYAHSPDVFSGLVVCILGALWGWHFFISNIRKIPNKVSDGNTSGFFLRVFILGTICLAAHIPVTLYIYVLYKTDYIERWINTD